MRTRFSTASPRQAHVNRGVIDAEEGCLFAAQARRLSPHTLANYTNSFRRLQRFLDADPPIDQTDVAQVCGNVYVLKRLLAHSSRDMCLRYLALAQSDADANHKVASPVMNWRL